MKTILALAVAAWIATGFLVFTQPGLRMLSTLDFAAPLASGKQLDLW